jgi:outer membrane protein assembly factor BamB
VLRADGTLITRFRTGGTVSSTPVLHRSRLYVASTDGNLWVFDEEAGRVVWTFKTEGALRSSPLPWGSLIFFASSDYRVYALEP